LLVSTSVALAQAPPPKKPAEKPAADKVESRKPDRKTKIRSVAELAKSTKASVVSVSFKARSGQVGGEGTGFVISEDGLIATNMHVLGEARPLTVRLANGKEYDVVEIYASQRSMDLAIIRINAKGLKPIPFGDSQALVQGEAVVALGNPHGLRYSVVTGVVSAKRKIGDQPMLQLAMPVEPGNSGGPVLNLFGQVVGIVTLKSAITQNLGFAVEINALKPLLKKPNPIAMKRWLTIGALSPQVWKPTMGANWRQRAGTIVVDQLGDGFGGRSLCIYQEKLPARPYEIAVTVKLDNESGAAGLIFSSDGGDKHYGFYPSGGRLRLTRFAGPDVFSWEILSNIDSPHYRPGRFNTLKVRLEKDRFLCYVNDHLVVESKDKDLKGGRVGLCKFRGTVAQFKSFQMAESIAPSRPSAKLVAQVTGKLKKVAADGELSRELIDDLKKHDKHAETVILEQAQLLDQKADQLRKLAAAVHQGRVIDRLAQSLSKDNAEQSLLVSALLVAKLDNPEVNVASYQREVARMAQQVNASLPKDADGPTKLRALNKYLFEESGFHGSRTDYYNRSNSYISEVIDDREGLPITLSVLYIDMGRRIGLTVEGVGMPYHFLARAKFDNKKTQLVDVFDKGKLITRDGAAAILAELTDSKMDLEDEHLKANTRTQIIYRMLRNLIGVAQQEEDYPRIMTYLNGIVAIEPEFGLERWMRAVLHYQLKEYASALEDARWLLEHHPDNVDMKQIRGLYERLLELHPDKE